MDRLAVARAALDACTWRPSRARVFVTTRPKAREIHEPAFADRVVHHWLVAQLEVLYESVFIHDSYANRRGKGTHAAVARLQTFMRQATRNGARRAYALQLDIANYFNTIDRRRLFGLISRRLDHSARRDRSQADTYARLAKITRRLLTGNPAHGAQRLGAPRRFDRVPKHKRLANALPERGLAIGNLSSQFFANVYLNELDQYIKHVLKCRWYVRYVDDLVLIHDDPDRLVKWRERIEGFIDEHLGLKLRPPASEPVAVSRGVDFLGYIVRTKYLLPRRRVVESADRCLARWHARLFGPSGMILDRNARSTLQNALASYLGHFRHASCSRVLARLWTRHPWLDLLFLRAGSKVMSKMSAPLETSLACQYSWFTSQYPNAIVWMQVGANWECYGIGATLVSQRYGLAQLLEPRANIGIRIVVPVTNWHRWQAIFARDGIAVIAAEQCGRARNHRHGLRQRALSYVSPAGVEVGRL